MPHARERNTERTRALPSGQGRAPVL